MNRRTFLGFVAAALVAPEELVLGRSQVSVPAIWTPTTLFTTKDAPYDWFTIWDPYDIEELADGKFLHRIRRREIVRPDGTRLSARELPPGAHHRLLEIALGPVRVDMGPYELT